MDWDLLIYRLPSQPSRARVAVWRELRRLGALPLQQGVVVLPALQPLRDRLGEIESRIQNEDGASYRFQLNGLDEAQEARLRSEWNSLREQEYAEIVEECETKFAKEVEFEIFRQNFTSGEAEEIEADLDKIKAWHTRVAERDLFGARNRQEAERAIERCARLLDDFVERVYRSEEIEEGGPVLDRPLDLPWGEIEDASTGSDHVVPLEQRRQLPKEPPARGKQARRTDEAG